MRSAAAARARRGREWMMAGAAHSARTGRTDGRMDGWINRCLRPERRALLAAVYIWPSAIASSLTQPARVNRPALSSPERVSARLRIDRIYSPGSAATRTCPGPRIPGFLSAPRKGFVPFPSWAFAERGKDIFPRRWMFQWFATEMVHKPHPLSRLLFRRMKRERTSS